jgi:hypothetical protein
MATKDVCGTCRKWRTAVCEWRKAENIDPGPNDWCRGWRKKEDACWQRVNDMAAKACGIGVGK